MIEETARRRRVFRADGPRGAQYGERMANDSPIDPEGRTSAWRVGQSGALLAWHLLLRSAHLHVQRKLVWTGFPRSKALARAGGKSIENALDRLIRRVAAGLALARGRIEDAPFDDGMRLGQCNQGVDGS